MVARAVSDIYKEQPHCTRHDVLERLTRDGSFADEQAQRAVGRAIGLKLITLGGRKAVADQRARASLIKFLRRQAVSDVAKIAALLEREAIVTPDDLNCITAADLIVIGVPLKDAIKIVPECH